MQRTAHCADTIECAILLLDFEHGALSYKAFRELCLAPNRPALIRNVAAQFQVHPAVSTIVASIDHQRTAMIAPFEHLLTEPGLAALFGDLTQKQCPAYRCPVLEEGEDPSCQPTTECINVTVEDVFTSWVTSQAQTLPFHHPDRLYLMNWHFQEEAEVALRTQCSSSFHQKDALYRIPEFLGFDLMHAYHLHCEHLLATSAPDDASEHSINANNTPSRCTPFGDGAADYRFVYIGVEGTWTPLHHDVFGTFSWSLNLSGKKLWYFLTPESQKVAETLWGPAGSAMSTPPPDIRVVANMTFDTVLQQEGELIFVPSRWYHQVHNLEGTAYPTTTTTSPSDSEHDAPRVVSSINHNWMSFEQIDRMVALFAEEVKSLLRMTDKETRNAFTTAEWKELVDRMLLGSGAWNVAVLQSFLVFVETLLHSLEHNATMMIDASSTQQWNDACGGHQLSSLMKTDFSTQLISEWRQTFSHARSILEECSELVKRTDSVG